MTVPLSCPGYAGKRVLITAVIVLLTAFLLPATATDSPDTARRAELIRLVRQDCGSCHGMRLSGGLGLPLTPETLRGKPVEGLVATISYGRPGTAMPGWRPFLSEAETRWIAEQLLTGFPDAP